MESKNVRQEIVSELAGMVIEQAREHGFPVEVDAIRGAVDQFVKFTSIDATEAEIVAASLEAERLASDVIIEAQISHGFEREVVRFNALDVLKHNNEPRTWQELVLDESHNELDMPNEDLQERLAKDYALYAFRRQHGNNRGHEVSLISQGGVPWKTVESRFDTEQEALDLVSKYRNCRLKPERQSDAKWILAYPLEAHVTVIPHTPTEGPAETAKVVIEPSAPAAKPPRMRP